MEEDYREIKVLSSLKTFVGDSESVREGVTDKHN